MNYTKSLFFITSLAFFILAACQGNVTAQPASETTSLPKQPIQQTNTPLPVSSKKEEVIKRINQVAASYNQFVENEKKTGNIELVNSQNGSEEFAFTNASDIKVANEFLRVQEIILTLNEEYYNLYVQEKKPTPFPNLSSQSDQYERLSKENSDWLAQEIKTGSTVILYSPMEFKYVPILIGDSYVAMKEKDSEITALRLSAVMPPAALIQADIELIQSVEVGNVKLADIGTYPYYRADIKLTTYETSTRFYTLYTDSHQVIEIIPKQTLSGNVDTSSRATGVSLSKLENLAKEFISKISPKTSLANLTPAPGAKEGTYFFRWEDRTKPALDDGQTYPFVQVGFNGNGELLNYYNTLPLAR